MFELFNSTGASMVLGVVLMGIGSFFIGGLFVYSILFEKSMMEEIILTPVGIQAAVGVQTEETTDSTQRGEEITGNSVYASSRGSKYYPKDCRAGNSLSKANIIWFKSAAEAKAAGYTISKGCQ